MENEKEVEILEEDGMLKSTKETIENLFDDDYESNSDNNIMESTNYRKENSTIDTISSNNVESKNIEVKQEQNNNENNNYHENTKHPIYLGYEVRIGFSILISIILFAVSCILLVKAMSSSQNKGITYDEETTIDYSVCLLPNIHYKEECLGSGMEYLSEITKNIPVTFNYNAIYTSKIPYDYKYYVKSTLKIFKPDEESKVLYTTDETLTSKTNIKATSDIVSISENVEIPFSKYNKYVTEYNNKYSLNSESYVEVALYLEGKDKSNKKVGKVVIPLSTQTFNVTKDEISNHNLVATSIKKTWKDEPITYAIISCVFSLIGILIIVRLLIFIFKSLNNKSKYEIKLAQILKEYDRIIVQLKDEQYPLSDKRVIKVSNFLELLDARDTLEKPIVHVRVNNIKSEFYVEDVDKVYKYVMKESDFIN